MRLEPYLEQQQDYTNLGQPDDGRVARQGSKPEYANLVEIAEQDTGQELAQHRRLAQSLREIASQLCRGQDHGQGEDQFGAGVSPGCR